MAIAEWENNNQKYIMYTSIDKMFFLRITLRRYLIDKAKPPEEWRHNLLIEPRFRKTQDAIDWAIKYLNENKCPDDEKICFLNQIKLLN